MRTRMVPVFTLMMALAMLGCTQRYTVRHPETSPAKFIGAAPEQTTMKVSDARAEEDKPLSMGTLQVELIHLEDEIAFIRANLAAELDARGLNVALVEGSDSTYQLQISKFRIRNSRSSGWSPYWTFTTLVAEFVGAEEAQPIVVYYRMGKVPVWSMDEVADPCYSVPMALLVKEIVAKINRYTAKLTLPDEEVDGLIAATSNLEDSKDFQLIFRLGFSNNSRAIPHLLKLAEHENETVAASAISSIGILGATDQFAYLKGRYQTSESIVKYSVLKAIGDLNIPEGRQFLETVKGSDDYQDGRIAEVVDLYL